MALCPICGRSAAPRAQNKALPFCSVRCKQIDLGKWLNEDYRVPVEDESDPEDSSVLIPSTEESA
jgi:hypothetical protein